MVKPFTKHDEDMLRIFSDPVEWAKHHLNGDTPRWYQEQILRHPHHRIVLRCGRRIGKCIEENQRILNPLTGEYAPVGELYRRFKEGSGAQPLTTLNEQYKLKQSEAFFIEDNGIKDTFRVRTKYGAEVVLTGNHPVLTLDGWVEVDALKVGDRIATPKSLPYFGDHDLEDREIILLAYLIGNGSVSGNHISLSCYNDTILREFKSIVESYDCELIQSNPNQQDYRVVGKQRGRNAIYQILRKHSVLGKRAHDKSVPKAIFQLPKKKIALFLNRLYATDGWAYSGTRPEIGYCSVSKQLMIDIKHLLTRFGIWSNLCRKQVKYNGTKREAYQLLIHRKQEVLSFADEINIFSKEDAVDIASIKALKSSNQEETVPKEVWKYVEQERKEKGLTRLQVVGASRERNARLRMQYAPSLSKVATYAENLQSAFLYDLARSDLHWEEVVAIEPLGQRQTYDVFVGETHNLVVEDILVHNTWTMTAHMVYIAFTCNQGKNIKKGATCLVATPYESQAREIFDQLKNFIDSSPILQESVKTITKNPYLIEFKNKSRIKLFTAGTRSGAEGGSLRGQKADWLYLDEMDYLSDKDFEAIYAIALEAPKRIGVMVASTPTGRRGKFYSICTDPTLKFNQDEVCQPGENNDYADSEYDRDTAEGWKEFHFPSMINPEWDVSMERELRTMYSDVAYEHEVLAEFGTEMVGVFNKEFIDEACSKKYHYINERRNNNPIAIGVDWDKVGSATQIVVVEYDTTDVRRMDEGEYTGTGRLKVINRVEIPRGEYTYDNAVRKLFELNNLYEPDFIYVDKGAGEYQLEMLRKHLGDKVKGVHLGSSYEVRDPISRTFDRKPLKPFLVSQTTLLLDRGMLRIPHRSIDETLYRQMTNYAVIRISAKTGEPTYTNEDEHALDALMFCVFGFIEEMPELLQTIEQINVARSIGFTKTVYRDPLKQVLRDNSSNEELPSYIKNWDQVGTSPPARKVSVGYRKKGNTAYNPWARGNGRRSIPTRRSW